MGQTIEQPPHAEARTANPAHPDVQPPVSLPGRGVFSTPVISVGGGEWNKSLLTSLRQDAVAGNVTQMSDAMHILDFYRNGGDKKLGIFEPAMNQFVNDLKEKGVDASWDYGMTKRPGFQFSPAGYDHAQEDAANGGPKPDMQKEIGYLRLTLGDKNYTISSNGPPTTDDGHGGQRVLSASERDELGAQLRKKMETT